MAGTDEVVPTFTREPINGVGAQLCPCNFAMATPQSFTVASRPATSPGQGVLQPVGPVGCALLPSPDLSGCFRPAEDAKLRQVELPGHASG